MMGLQEPVALIAHDAGAANHILAWLGHNPGAKVCAYMAGPAETLWQQAFSDRPLSNSIDEAMSAARIAITGTGWASDVEHNARKLAITKGLRNIAVIDHWTNYPDRFERFGEIVLPDEIWVSDHWASRIARAAFPSIPVHEKPNTYLASQIDNIAKLPSGQGILFVGEPARDNWGRQDPGEIQALEYFLKGRATLGWPMDAPVKLRPHPSEAKDKYAAQILNTPELELDVCETLAEAIASAEYVVGMQSYALTIALAAGKKVCSALPPWAPPCVLPHEAIIQLRHRYPMATSKGLC